MSNHATLSAALPAAFNLDADGAKPEAVADAAATVLCAFAEVMRGPVQLPIPVIRDNELTFITAELAPLSDQAALICEIRALIQEIRADRDAARRTHYEGPFTGGCNGVVNGAAASGLPG